MINRNTTSIIGVILKRNGVRRSEASGSRMKENSLSRGQSFRMVYDEPVPDLPNVPRVSNAGFIDPIACGKAVLDLPPKSPPIAPRRL